MLQLDFSDVKLRLKQEDSHTKVFDIIRKKWVMLTPEEQVRQYIANYFVQVMKYPAAMIAIEKKILVGRLTKRFDIIVYERNHKPWMLVECKAPDIFITEKTLEQLLNYQRTVQSLYWLLSNGHQTYCANATDIQNIEWENNLPAYNL